MSDLGSCNSCEGLSPETPIRIFNRPGLQAIAYRVGNYQKFRESLLSRISGGAGYSPLDLRLRSLAPLRKRSTDDFSIALLDAWAIASDVLTFYQERIANESYLRTSTERFSVLQLARLIGYELRPGVAANTYLAFTLEGTSAMPTPGATTIDPLPPPLVLDAGIKVQSVPDAGEQAQLFETVEKIQARTEWNAIKPRSAYAQSTQRQSGFLIFDDLTNDLKKGDVLLIKNNSALLAKKILSVKIDEKARITKVFLASQTSVSPSNTDVAAIADGKISTIAETELTDAVIAKILQYTWKAEDLEALAVTKKWNVGELMTSLQAMVVSENISGNLEAFVFRKTASPFGYNAPKKVAYDARNRPKPPSGWIEWDLDEKCERVFLDSEYKEVVAGSYIATLERGADFDDAKIFNVNQATICARSRYGLQAKSTFLKISSDIHTCWYDKTGANDKLSLIRGITHYIQSEPLPLALLPIEDNVKGDTVMLDRWYPNLRVGQMIILSGQRVDPKGEIASEAMQLKEVLVQKGYTLLRFKEALTNTYIRSSVVINANVALATHGETVNEVLGSGDASASFQTFTLRQPPLTHVSASSATGIETTLKIYVNDVLWHEVESLFGHGSDERIYITRLQDDGKTVVTFGNGATGSRLPSGPENIRATYRKGIGTGGLVKANQLSQLLTRPLGVKSAVNPSAAKDAADAETLDEARNNATLTLMTFDRVVSLQDFEDFARAFAGIEKSLATWSWRNRRRCIFITVAGTNGATIESGSVLYDNLLKAIRKGGDSRVAIEMQSYQPRFFRLKANIQIHPDYLVEKILPTVEEKLRSTFSFKARSFGQPVALSEVITVIQQEEGVISVDVDSLYYSDDTPGLTPLLIAKLPDTGGVAINAAELLTIDPAPLELTVTAETQS